MSPVDGSYQVHSEPRGPHWIAWIVRAASEKPDKLERPDRPDRGIVLVGETQEEAESRARRFAEESFY